jgi:HD-GYP domain-containing protein (c-di-GMP phosphodiesterase class II)
MTMLRKILEDKMLAADESRQLFTEVVRALAKKIDDKDFYTRGHSERVTRFSVEIARIMNLAEEEIEKVTIGALIHDIGKLDIDDQILKKKTLLTDEEYEIMKTHTTRGHDMLKHIPQLRDIIPCLQSHHEQLDGKGYPQGLKGDEIPLIARIIMVADCFDAMTTARPYQDPAPVDYVLGVIRSFAGTKYDERVVDALVEAVKMGRIVSRPTE